MAGHLLSAWTQPATIRPVPEIAEALTGLRVPVDSLRPHPRNPRRGDVSAIVESLKEFGQVRPIVTTPDGTIVAGHHVYYAAQELGWTDIAAVQPDLTEAQAQRYLLADNRLAELGSYDQEALGGLLEEIMDAGGLEGTGWKPDDVDDLMAAMGTVPTTEPEEFTGDYVESPEETAERWNGRDSAQPMREVVLMLKAEEFEPFAEDLRALKTAYGLDATTATVREAVRREAEAQQHGADGQ